MAVPPEKTLVIWPFSRTDQPATVLGYVRHNIKPLACDGPDAVENMQWQTVADAKAKDRWERGACGR